MSSEWTPRDDLAAGPADDTAELEALAQQLAATPAVVIITNHCYGLFELAAVHLHHQPPQLEQAQLAIDALGGLIGALEGRLGEDEPTLRDGLSTIRLAYVQIEAAHRAVPPPTDAP